MPEPEVVYVVAGVVVAGLAGFVAYALAFAPPLVPVSSPVAGAAGPASQPPGGDSESPSAS